MLDGGRCTWLGFISIRDSHRDHPFLFFGFLIRLKKNTEDYRNSSAIDYTGGKGLLEVLVV